ncbi:MAG: hypothetical protein DMG06_08265 [Acidobacteria bacterium]|nr:MAG: hypothetical protein DMG06_08265 [Acidobacteriota bacterium]
MRAEFLEAAFMLRNMPSVRTGNPEHFLSVSGYSGLTELGDVVVCEYLDTSCHESVLQESEAVDPATSM